MVKAMSMTGIRTQFVKKTCLLLLTVIMAAGFMIAVGVLRTQEVHAMEGNGTKDSPYEITSYTDLKEFADIVNGTNGQSNTYACAILKNNIVCTDKNWKPIGEDPYLGHFDGNGKIIIGLSNEESGSPDDCQGLFGQIGTGGEVKDVGLEGGKIVGMTKVGGIVGFASENVSITNCYNSGAVNGIRRNVGGVAGKNNGSISNCYNCGPVIGPGDYIGGVAGENNGTITNCYNSGQVIGDNVNGVVGLNFGTIRNCYYDTTFNPGLSAIMKNDGVSDDVRGLPTSDMTGAEAIGDSHMNFSDGKTNWLMKPNDQASGENCEYYMYYPHLKGFNSASEEWPARAHVHKVGDETIYFYPWGVANQMPDQAGNYFLTSDVTLDKSWDVPDGTTSLCMNDHSITYRSDITRNCITVDSTGPVSLNLYDCGTTSHDYYIGNDGLGHVRTEANEADYTSARKKGSFKGGYITGGNTTSDGGGVFIGNGSMTMNGGTIIGNKAVNGGGVFVSSNGTFTMTGGRITGNAATSYGGGVFVRCEYDGLYARNGGTLNVSGAPVITRNSIVSGNPPIAEENDVYLPQSRKVSIAGDGLAKGAQIGVSYGDYNTGFTNGVFTDGWNDVMTDPSGAIADPTNYFRSNRSEWGITLVTTPNSFVWGEACLVDAAVAPEITTEPSDLNLTYGAKTGNILAVEATAAEEHSLSYQWYSSETESTEDGAPIDGETNVLYTIPEDESVGTKYYYCIVTATSNIGTKATATSRAAKVTIIQATPTIATAPTASAIDEGQTLADSILSNGIAKAGETIVPGTFAWADPSIKPAVSDSGKTGYDVIFTPNDTKNYETATTKITLTVNSSEPPETSTSTSIDNAPVVLDLAPLTFTDQPITPVIQTIGGKTLQEGRDYTITYSQNGTPIEAPTDAGTYTMTITGKGDFAGSTSMEFTIGKAAGTLNATGNKVKAKSKTVKLKKAKKISAEKAYTIEGVIGELTYTKVKANKASKKFKVNAATGQIKVKKGLKKGKYKLTVLISDSGDKNHEAAEAEAVVKIRIRK